MAIGRRRLLLFGGAVPPVVDIGDNTGGRRLAIWSGSGVALITVVGRYFFGQVLDPPALIGIGMIVAGVLVLQLFSTSVVR